ncbi:MAG TPA: hypothetical protein VGI70_11720, partial [Polyangiales bacterium]
MFSGQLGRSFCAHDRCAQLISCLFLIGCSADGSSHAGPHPYNGGSYDNSPPPASGIGGDGGGSGTGLIADNPSGFAGQSGSSALLPPIAGSSAATGCTGLQCQQHSCSTGSTTISGTIYDPAGKNPLYAVAVYVPNEKPAALTLGASCDKCSALYTGKPVVTSLTDATGKFVIKDA